MNLSIEIIKFSYSKAMLLIIFSHLIILVYVLTDLSIEIAIPLFESVATNIVLSTIFFY